MASLMPSCLQDVRDSMLLFHVCQPTSNNSCSSGISWRQVNIELRGCITSDHAGHVQRLTSIRADNGMVQPCSHAGDFQPTQGLHQSGCQHVGARLAGHSALAVQVAAPGVERAGLSQRAAVPRAACNLPAEHWMSQVLGIDPRVAGRPQWRCTLLRSEPGCSSAQLCHALLISFGYIFWNLCASHRAGSEQQNWIGGEESPEGIRLPRPSLGSTDTYGMQGGRFLSGITSLRCVHARKLPSHAHAPISFATNALPTCPQLHTSAQLPVHVAAPCPHAAIIQHSQAG